MTVMAASRNPTNIGDLLRSDNPTGEQMIRVLACRAPVPGVFKAHADSFEQVLMKATVSRPELLEMATWAATGLSHCAEHGMPGPAAEFEKILTACDRELKRMEPSMPAPDLRGLKGWRL